MIKNARREDFGSYGCKAANEVGVEYKLFNLKQEGEYNIMSIFSKHTFQILFLEAMI